MPCFGCFSRCAAAAFACRLFLAAAVTLLLELWNLPWSWSRAAFFNAPNITVSCALPRQMKHWERPELTYWTSPDCARVATFSWMSTNLMFAGIEGFAIWLLLISRNGYTLKMLFFFKLDLPRAKNIKPKSFEIQPHFHLLNIFTSSEPSLSFMLCNRQFWPLIHLRSYLISIHLHNAEDINSMNQLCHCWMCVNSSSSPAKVRNSISSIF